MTLVYYTVITMTLIRGGTQVYTGASRSFDSLNDAKVYAKTCLCPSDSRIILKIQSDLSDPTNQRISEIKVVPEGMA